MSVIRRWALLLHSCIVCGMLRRCCSSLMQVSALIAGPDDTQQAPQAEVTIRKLGGQAQTITLQREGRVISSPVQYHLDELQGGKRKVGVIKLTSFNARAQRDVALALTRLEQKGAQEYVIDLRDNRGGLVSEGLEVARLFLQVRSRNSELKHYNNRNYGLRAQTRYSQLFRACCYPTSSKASHLSTGRVKIRLASIDTPAKLGPVLYHAAHVKAHS